MSDVLNAFKLSYEDLPSQPRKGGKVNKMTKQTKEVTTDRKRTKYAPTRTEVAKTVIIAVLVTAVIAFVAGVRYANSQHEQVAQAIKAAQVTAQAPTSK